MTRGQHALRIVALAALLSGAGVAAAEVKLATVTGEASGQSPTLVPESSVAVQCWQGGSSIFESSGLDQASVVPLLPATTQAAANGNVGLRFRDQTGSRVTLVPLGEALCLIRGSVGTP